MPANRRKATILVVEDDADLRAYYRTALSISGYSVVTAEDGVEALRQIERNPPHAVVLDLSLPRLAGTDVQKELASRSETRDIPIVVVTGTNIADLDQSRFACVLRKPVESDALVRTVNRCVTPSSFNGGGLPT